MSYQRRAGNIRSYLTANDSAYPWPPMASGRYYRVPNATVATSAALGINVGRYVPKFIPSTTTLSRIGAEVTSAGEAGSKYRLGIYSDNGFGRPSALILDAGQIAGDSVAIQELTINQTLTRGWYWFVGVVQSVVTTQPTIRTANVPVEASLAGDLNTEPVGAGELSFGFIQNVSLISGALPSTPTVAGNTGTGPMIFVKVA